VYSHWYAHRGHLPRVSNVFQEQSLQWLHHHRELAWGFHWHSGQRMRSKRSRSVTPVSDSSSGTR
jgi:hypothetical protein